MFFCRHQVNIEIALKLKLTEIGMMDPSTKINAKYNRRTEDEVLKSQQ
jgi:hypothetical protein